VTRVLCAIVAAAALAIAGCGGGDDTGTPAGTAEAYFKAIQEGDGATACSLLTGDALRGTATSGVEAGNECATAVSGMTGGAFEDVSAETQEESASAATVLVTLAVSGQGRSQISVGLVKDGEEWKIASLGVPTAG
jgi:Domain of unknown function (DUF4878)